MAHIMISTHTLTWSVTATDIGVFGFSSISTHTLTWSVTVVKSCYQYVYMDFNSHAHVERDLIGICFFKITLYFNSHAHVERDYRYRR